MMIKFALVISLFQLDIALIEKSTTKTIGIYCLFCCFSCVVLVKTTLKPIDYFLLFSSSLERKITIINFFYGVRYFRAIDKNFDVFAI